MALLKSILMSLLAIIVYLLCVIGAYQIGFWLASIVIFGGGIFAGIAICKVASGEWGW
jgi:hypothetical protein